MTDGEKAIASAARNVADIGIYFFLAYTFLLTGEMAVESLGLIASGVFAPMLLPVPIPERFQRYFTRRARA